MLKTSKSQQVNISKIDQVWPSALGWWTMTSGATIVQWYMEIKPVAAVVTCKSIFTLVAQPPASSDLCHY